MAKDFTIACYRILLRSLSEAGYTFTTVAGYRSSAASKLIILRHDVDAYPLNSVETARIENESGIKGTYYFRCGRNGFERNSVTEIARLGHETGYHYEDLAVARRRAKNGMDEYEVASAAYGKFSANLQKLREITEVTTICMHGSPLSRIDSRMLWKHFDYRENGIMAEPYLDYSFEEMLYLTDTGRRWDGSSFSVRDKARQGIENPAEGFTGWKVIPLPGSLMNMTPGSTAMQSGYRYRSTGDIVNAASEGRLPDRIMMTVHPQRWSSSCTAWFRELVMQNVKNGVKYFIIRMQ